MELMFYEAYYSQNLQSFIRATISVLITATNPSSLTFRFWHVIA